MTQNILKSDLSKFGKDLQGIFINVMWKTNSRLNQNGKSINDLKHLKIPLEAMKGGIVFISCEKEVLGQLVDTMEDLGFTYIENFQVIYLSSEKCLSYLSDKEAGSSSSLGGDSTASQSNFKEESFEKNITISNSQLKSTKKNQKKSKGSTVDEQRQFEEAMKLKLSKIPEKSEQQIMEDKDKIIDSIPVLKQAKINDLFLNNDYPVFKKSKHTILMFRKFGEKGTTLELRHQRTSDVVFEVTNEYDPSNLDKQLKGYVYQMIETLLPKAQFDPTQGKNSYKLMELFADKDHPRSGWISVCEK